MGVEGWRCRLVFQFIPDKLFPGPISGPGGILEPRELTITAGPCNCRHIMVYLGTCLLIYWCVQRVFWNEKERKAVSFVYFGDGLDGWLKVTHGGALATALDENMGRVAVRTFPERTGVTANLNINYRSPALTGFLYKITTTIDQERSTDRKAFLVSEIRGPTGNVCTDATGVFVVPKNMKLQKIGDQY